jgi:anti-sigma B factor antagonist
VWVPDELDLVTAPTLGRILGDALDDGYHVLVDMSAVTFIDGFTVRVLAGAVRHAQAVGSEMSLRSPSRVVRRILGLTKLDQLLPMED